MSSFAIRDVMDAVERNDTSFDTRIADVTTNRLDLPATYPFNTERHRLVVNGSEIRDPSTTSKFNDLNGKWQLVVSDGDTVEFTSRERLRYVPNYESLFGAVLWYESVPTDGQGARAELSDDNRTNAYRYDFDPANTQCELASSGTGGDTLPRSEWGDFPTATDRDHDPLSQEGVDRTTPSNPRGLINWYGAGNFRPTISYTRENGLQYNPELGALANVEDIATEEINLRVRVVADAAAGASEYTVNIGSLGALIRGNATQVDRPAPFVATDLGGSISGSFTDNEPILAIRNDSDFRNVVTELLPFPFSPASTSTMEVAAVVVPESDTDASGFVSPRLVNPQNDVIRATTQVTSFPTESATTIDGTTGVTVPNVDRVLATVVAKGGGKQSASGDTTQTEIAEKRVWDNSPVTDDEIVLFLVRRIDGNDNSITWLKVPTRQDW